MKYLLHPLLWWPVIVLAFGIFLKSHPKTIGYLAVIAIPFFIFLIYLVIANGICWKILEIRDKKEYAERVKKRREELDRELKLTGKGHIGGRHV